MEEDIYSSHAKATWPAPQLRRSLHLKDGVALTVSNVVGVGIFTTPAIVAALVPNSTAILVLWLVGGLLALAGAMSYAELARTFPRAGGEYVYLTKVYGPIAGFLSGWTSLIAGFSVGRGQFCWRSCLFRSIFSAAGFDPRTLVITP